MPLLAMDRTTEFINVAQRLGYGENVAAWEHKQSNYSEFVALALEIHQRVHSTKEYISSKRRKYLMFTAGSLIMSEKERDAFEAFVSKNLKESLSLLIQLKNLVGVEDHSTDARESCLRAYRLGVISSLMELLRTVEEDFSALRIQRVLNVTTSEEPSIPRKTNTSNNTERPLSNMAIENSNSLNEGDMRTHDQRSRGHKQLILEGENQTMLLDLMETLEQVKSVERQAVEIAALNQVLSIKLSEQAEEIESLYHDAIYSLENVQKGNKELKRLSKKNSSWNFYWIFCILVATFSLLFLHWIS
ncbi:hypothetical protein GpartN1_g2079.t1 [Galdieria partita]|uniref:Syntaxin 18 n=1 Tax=Galdieria partita TaxID=83374 RepID=A0A9C7PT60_9RHOD|nr:hypothetical protein GpartN1_g2079.t1 [Galdieria partita]